MYCKYISVLALVTSLLVPSAQTLATETTKISVFITLSILIQLLDCCSFTELILKLTGECWLEILS